MTNEAIWSGRFGDEYTDRNRDAYVKRFDWWQKFCRDYHFKSALEVGCNVGANLGMIAAQTKAHKSTWGCDINEKALVQAKTSEPRLNFVYASGLDLPFRDNYFDLVFTCGVLIHQTPETVEAMMQEIIRVSGKYVMAIEYESQIFEEIPYRGLRNALYKGPWGDVYEKRYGLKLLNKVKLDKREGFDDVTAWILGWR